MKRKLKRERGVALIFAIGLLSLLLVIGLAFVANALSAKKVAGNNSGRTQAKMFALSAANRAAASVMMYQHQIYMDETFTSFPESFASIYSYGKRNDEADNAAAPNSDGLLGKSNSSSTSIMLLPEDNSVLSKAAAIAYNKPLKYNANEPWQGKWVYFYNTQDHNSDDCRIIGRAAWQVLSNSAQISAPVFFRGALGDKIGDKTASETLHRWGRDIFEVKLGNTTHFKNIPAGYDGEKIETFVTLYNNGTIIAADDGDKRWVEKWLTPDPEAASDSNAAWDPNATKLTSETYYFQKSDTTQRQQLMRFNISDLYSSGENKITEYGISADHKSTADPWYARFRIDSASASEAAHVNSDYVLEDLTRDGQIYVEDEYDYNITNREDRSGLPFLRRIGSDGDNHTFPDNSAVTPTVSGIEYLRKQIAANMNDYCDADTVPTSDVAASTWKSLTPDAANEPKYTGNEKTPYLYELGALVGFRESASSSDKGLAATLNSGKLSFTSALKIAPVVKLAKIYEVASGEFNDLSALVDFGAVEYTFLLNKVTLKGFKITYKVGEETQSYVCGDEGWSSALSGTDVPSALTNLGAQTFKSTFTKLDAANETEGIVSFGEIATSPYPLALPAAANWYQRNADANVIGTQATYAFTLSDADAEKILRKVKTGLNDTVYGTAKISVQPTELSVESIKLTSFSVAPDRMVLLQGTNGLDYVRKFTQGFKWSSASGLQLDFVAEGGSSAKPDFVLGGIRNYDPRQNLNNKDWYPLGSASAEKSLMLVPIADCSAVTKDVLIALKDTANNPVINVDTVNKGYGTTDLATENKYFSPKDKTTPGDTELAPEPAFQAADHDKHLSTAFIRNAPMMSPWELGLIHRGIKWQTINLKSSYDPNTGSVPVRVSSFDANGSAWNKSGTTYAGGDAGLLDQIKMTQQCATYGKINVNMFNVKKKEYDSVRDLDIFKALFDGIYFGETIYSSDSTKKSLYKNSARVTTGTNEGVFVGESSGDNTLTADQTAMGKMAAVGNSAELKKTKAQSETTRYTSRAQLINFTNGSAKLANAFGLVENGENDAEQEEIIGKTINLLTAETTSPNQVQIIVVAQSIKDVAGKQFRTTSATSLNKTNKEITIADGMASADCEYGKFDAGIDSDDDGKNVYFDEITGEVKMLVTIDRNPTSGKMSIRRIDYLE